MVLIILGRSFDFQGSKSYSFGRFPEGSFFRCIPCWEDYENLLETELPILKSIRHQPACVMRNGWNKTQIYHSRFQASFYKKCTGSFSVFRMVGGHGRLRKVVCFVTTYRRQIAISLSLLRVVEFCSIEPIGCLENFIVTKCRLHIVCITNR